MPCLDTSNIASIINFTCGFVSTDSLNFFTGELSPMKKITTVFASLCLLFIYTQPVHSKGANSPWYLGVKGGFMDGGKGVSDNAVNMGFDLGYKNNRYLSTEIEYTQTFIDGETRNGNDWDVTTLSAFAALRSNTSVKLKGKIGLTHIDYGRDDDIELSMGLGVGFWALGGLTEIEYTKIDNDNDLDFFSIGVNFFF